MRPFICMPASVHSHIIFEIPKECNAKQSCEDSVRTDQRLDLWPREISRGGAMLQSIGDTGDSLWRMTLSFWFECHLVHFGLIVLETSSSSPWPTLQSRYLSFTDEISVDFKLSESNSLIFQPYESLNECFGG